MAAHSSILAWRILQTEEPSGLQSMQLQRVRHDERGPQNNGDGTGNGKLVAEVKEKAP